jgi:hypothetical protein
MKSKPKNMVDWHMKIPCDNLKETETKNQNSMQMGHKI